jgi:hypothetical protein
VADWTVIIASGITGATSITTGVLGYLIARQQSKTDQKRLAYEEDRHQRGLLETRRDERRVAYTEFLRYVNRYTVDVGQLAEDRSLFKVLLADVMLLGNESIRHLAEGIEVSIGRFSRAWDQDAQHFRMTDEEAAIESRRLVDLRSDIADAMRADLAEPGA